MGNLFNLWSLKNEKYLDPVRVCDVCLHAGVRLSVRRAAWLEYARLASARLLRGRYPGAMVLDDLGRASGLAQVPAGCRQREGSSAARFARSVPRGAPGEPQARLTW